MVNNGRVTVAEIKKDISYLQKHQEEIKTDINEIKSILIKGSGKISANRESIKSIWKVFAIIVSVLGLAITAIAALN